MREIEFRAWLKKEKKIVEVVSINFNDKVIAYNDNEKQELCINCSFEDVELLEFTGIKDKNGTKIFEGDIVKYGTKIDIDIFVADFDNNDLSFSLKTKTGAYLPLYIGKEGRLEVIGNIYENPELLGENND